MTTDRVSPAHGAALLSLAGAVACLAVDQSWLVVPLAAAAAAVSAAAVLRANPTGLGLHAHVGTTALASVVASAVDTSLVAMLVPLLVHGRLTRLERAAWCAVPVVTSAVGGTLVVLPVVGLAVWAVVGAPTPPTVVVPDPARVVTASPEIQEADRRESLGMLAGGIAHDFNNLLTSILGNANLAIIDLPPGPPREAVVEIETASRRAKELVAQLLGYAGKGSVEIVPIRLDRLVEEMVGLLKRVVSARADVVVEGGGSETLIEADPSQVRQVVMNLLTNASDALAGDEGSIRVRIVAVKLDRQALDVTMLGSKLPTGSYVLLEVADTGVGMAPEVAARVFQPFFTTKASGRGLGLAALIGIVRSHAGTLQLESALGKGTTFRVYFPFAVGRDADEDIPTEQAVRVPSLPTRRGIALVAEDDDIVRRVATRMLSRVGYEVLAVRDGNEALAVLREKGSTVCLLLLDLQMPGVDGREVLAHMGEMQIAGPVVVMTGFTERDVGSLPRAPEAVLRKPFSIKDLADALEKAELGWSTLRRPRTER